MPRQTSLFCIRGTPHWFQGVEEDSNIWHQSILSEKTKRRCRNHLGRAFSGRKPVCPEQAKSPQQCRKTIPKLRPLLSSLTLPTLFDSRGGANDNKTTARERTQVKRHVVRFYATKNTLHISPCRCVPFKPGWVHVH